VVGGGNSAGQAAVFLSQTARKVYMLVRSAGLAETMSRYLIQRIACNPSIELPSETEIVGLTGEDQLEEVSWIDRKAGKQPGSRYITSPLWRVHPRTQNGSEDVLRLMIKGFILTGRDLPVARLLGGDPGWPLDRDPQLPESSLPGVFGRRPSRKRKACRLGGW
jgi:thioredoxin reductase (NADPH)